MARCGAPIRWNCYSKALGVDASEARALSTTELPPLLVVD